MAKSGVKKSIAKKAYTNVQKDLQSLESHMNQLVNHVQQMNTSSWYGSDTANKWYTTMRGHYCAYQKGNLVVFFDGVTAFQASLATQFKKASLKGIDFGGGAVTFSSGSGKSSSSGGSSSKSGGSSGKSGSTGGSSSKSTTTATQKKISGVAQTEMQKGKSAAYKASVTKTASGVANTEAKKGLNTLNGKSNASSTTSSELKYKQSRVGYKSTLVYNGKTIGTGNVSNVDDNTIRYMARDTTLRSDLNSKAKEIAAERGIKY